MPAPPLFTRSPRRWWNCSSRKATTASQYRIDRLRRRFRALLQDRRNRHLQRLPRHQRQRNRNLRRPSTASPIEFRVGTDALAIVVNPEQRLPHQCDHGRAGQVLLGKAQKWSDVNPAWPAEDIQRYTPGTDSGTFDFFIEVVMTKDDKDAGEGQGSLPEAANLQQSEDDNVLVQGVEGDPYAIGFFGFAYYKENADKLKVLSVDGITPTSTRLKLAPTRWPARCSSTRTPPS